ncbi:hypothetical protein [Ramlibacter sp. PS4R-6]|uniref:hypothetical protein n=1 Tax=Ramlibacter sp. PS4R-6 TaxID=3133438 RepID=UPI00309FAC61
MARRRRSDAAQVAEDTAFIANKLPWWGAALFGVFSFALFYWLLPWWINSRIEMAGNSALRPAIEAMLGRRIHWSQYVAIALALICAFFAVRNYFRSDRLKYPEVKDASFFGRLLARFLD